MIAGTTHLHLDHDQCRRALEARDRRFDGRFIVGVTSTGIYCRPSCPTPVHPKPENTRYFRTAAAAQGHGLRACKRCQPDASPGSPEWDLRDDLVGRAVRLIEQGEVDRVGVDGLADQLAVGPRHLRRVLQQDLGAGPLALARAQRAQTARILIETTALPMSTLAFAAGFASIRQFNATIREVFAVSPSELRSRKGSRAAASGLVPAASAPGDRVPMSLALRLPYREPFAADATFAWFQARAIPGVARGDANHHERALRLPHGPGVVRLSDGGGHIDCKLTLASLKDLPAAIAGCRRLLDLDADPTAIADHLGSDAILQPGLDATPGIRVPGSVDGFETAVFALMGQQRSIGAAVTLTGRIAAAAAPVDSAQVMTDHLMPFPTAAEVIAADLSGLGLTKRNIASTRAVAERVEAGDIDLGPGADRVATRTGLLDVHGIGPWTADYIAMRALGDPDVSLPGDLIIKRVADAHGVNDLEARSEDWRPWRSYAMHLLWSTSSGLHHATKPSESK